MTAAASTTLERNIRLALFAAIGGLIALLFHRHGITGAGYNVGQSTHSLFVWLSQRWIADTAYFNDFPFGWAAPLVSFWMVWRLRHLLAASPKRESWIGFALVLAALLALWVGLRTQQPRISASAFLLLIWAIPLHCFGGRVARMLVVPTGFLLFMIPFDLLTGLILRTRIFVTSASSALLYGLGIPLSIADPTTLRSTTTPAFTLALSSYAGGLRSFMYVTAAAVLLAWMRQRGPLRQVLLLAGVPFIVVVAGIARTVLQGIGWAAGGTPAADWMGAAPGFYLAAGLALYGWHRAVARLPLPGDPAP